MTPTVIIAIVVIFIAALVLSKGKKKSKPLPDVTRGKTDWRVENSPGVAVTPVPITDGSGQWFVDYPTNPLAGLHSIHDYSPPAFSVDGNVRFRARIEGEGFAPSQDISQPNPGTVAVIGLMLQRKGDNQSGDPAYKGHRLYSQWFVPIVAGEIDVTLALTPDLWTNRDGKNDPVGFAATLANLSNVAITNGHTSGRAHGVFAAPGARLILLGLEPA